jgi:hypothetical protein
MVPFGQRTHRHVDFPEVSLEIVNLSLHGESRRVPGGVIHPAPCTEGGERVRFSLATIAEEQPPQIAGGCDDAFVLHEDTWRQCEFFPEKNIGLVNEMVSFLSAHESHMGDGTGFHEMYVRDESPTSVGELSLRLSTLRESIPTASQHRALALCTASGNPQLVTGGFAITLPGGGIVYGRTDGDKILSLSFLLIHGQDNPTQEAIQQLATYAKNHCLLVVDWLLLVVLRPAISTTIWEWPSLHAEVAKPQPEKRPWWRFW